MLSFESVSEHVHSVYEHKDGHTSPSGESTKLNICNRNRIKRPLLQPYRREERGTVSGIQVFC